MPTKQRPDPYVGRTLGNVALREKIGQGGMGMVYKGWHERFAKEVAVKLLPPQPGEKQAQFQERFVREGRAAARIQHQNVVQVMDAGTDQGISYLVLEFVNGSSLGDVLDSKQQLDPEVVERLGLGIAKGIAAIHAQGIIHRDIKPDNILLGRDGMVKITDLGLAREMDDPEINRLTATGMVVGTPLYVAPEAIMDNKTAGTASDIYSFGATLYHMLTGKPPFNEKSPYEVMRAHLDKRVQPVRELNGDVPKPLANVVQACLEKDPAKRPDADGLIAILSHEGKLVDQRPNRGGVFLMVALVLVGVAALGAWQFLEHYQPADETTVDPAWPQLRFDLDETLEWRQADGSWRTIADQQIRLAPGSHQLALRTANTIGVRRYWSGAITMVSGEDQKLRPTLVVKSVEPVAVALPADSQGVIFVDGKAHGSLEREIFLDLAGEHAIGRWDGKRWVSGTTTISAEGTASPIDWQEATTPRGRAYFSQHIDGKAVPPHHLAVWQEVEWARQEFPNVPTGTRWSLGAAQPDAVATGLNAGLVRALAEHYQTSMRLPEPDEARELAEQYGNAIWTKDQDVLRPEGMGSATTALLVLVPR